MLHNNIYNDTNVSKNRWRIPNVRFEHKILFPTIFYDFLYFIFNVNFLYTIEYYIYVGV